MASFSKVIIMGNVTRDPEVKALPSGTSVAQFSVAINRRWKDTAGEQKEEVSFVEISFFGKPAEICEKYVHKGDSIVIEGRLKQDTWEKDGVKRSKLHVIGEKLHLMPKRGEKDAETAAETAGDEPGTDSSKSSKKKNEEEVPF
jgi:single-strand DNA-binding protein